MRLVRIDCTSLAEQGSSAENYYRQLIRKCLVLLIIQHGFRQTAVTVLVFRYLIDEGILFIVDRSTS